MLTCTPSFLNTKARTFSQRLTSPSNFRRKVEWHKMKLMSSKRIRNRSERPSTWQLTHNWRCKTENSTQMQMSTPSSKGRTSRSGVWSPSSCSKSRNSCQPTTLTSYTLMFKAFYNLLIRTWKGMSRKTSFQSSQIASRCKTLLETQDTGSRGQMATSSQLSRFKQLGVDTRHTLPSPNSSSWWRRQPWSSASIACTC